MNEIYEMLLYETLIEELQSIGANQEHILAALMSENGVSVGDSLDQMTDAVGQYSTGPFGGEAAYRATGEWDWVGELLIATQEGAGALLLL